MEVNSIIAPEPRSTVLEITFGIGILYGTTNGFNETKGATPIPTIMFVDAPTHFGGIANLTFFNMTTKDERANPMVKTSMEIRTSIPS